MLPRLFASVGVAIKTNMDNWAGSGQSDDGRVVLSQVVKTFVVGNQQNPGVMLDTWNTAMHRVL